MTQGMIVLGRIVSPYGVQGWVKLHPFGDDPAAWQEKPQWWLCADPDSGKWRPCLLQGMRMHGKGLIAKLEGVDDRNAAEALDGFFVGMPHEALPDTAKDEFYWADLVGLEVVNLQGESFGRVAELLSSGAHEILCVRCAKVGEADASCERLLPFVAQVVRQVDVAQGVIRVEWGADW